MRYLQLTVTDTLGFWDDYLGDYLFNREQSKTFTIWYRLPDEWFDDGALIADRREALLRHLYGETWRLGNDDGSRYVLLGLSERLLDEAEVAVRPWEQARTSYYELAGDGALIKHEPASSGT